VEAEPGAGRQGPEALLDSYDAERTFAADENILNSTRSTDFITPRTVSAGLSGTPRWSWPGITPSPAPSSTAAACQRLPY